MRSNSRKNTSIDLDEEVGPQDRNEDLMRKISEKMREFELLKKATDLRVINGLGAVPLAKVLPPRIAIGQATGEGTQEKEEGIEINEYVPTQPPPTATIDILVTNAPLPPPVNVTIGQSGIQGFKSST